jgi:hypothetical protein
MGSAYRDIFYVILKLFVGEKEVCHFESNYIKREVER